MKNHLTIVSIVFFKRAFVKRLLIKYKPCVAFGDTTANIRDKNNKQ
jgi:hypothetical protein